MSPTNRNPYACRQGEAQAQVQQPDHFHHEYTLLIPNNLSRKWATQVLKTLRVQRQYISRRRGYYTTGDLNYVARYTGLINNDQHRALLTTYLPYAPPGTQYSCPTCS